MIKASFSKEEIEQLYQSVLEHPHRFIRNKALILLLKSFGLPTKKIAETLNVCENTICNHMKSFVKGRIPSVLEVKFHRPKSRLNGFAPIIKTYLETNRPETVKQACIDIKQLTQANLKESQIRKYLKSLEAKAPVSSRSSVLRASKESL